MKPPTHIAYEKGCDNRTPDNYRREVFIRETKNFWITTKGMKYHKHNGSCLGDWPTYKIILESIKPLPTYTATLFKNEKVDNPNVKDDFIKRSYLWEDKDTYKSMSMNSYEKDGYPVNPNNPIKVDIKTIQPFILTPDNKKGG